ncbi:PIN domain-containing protein [Dyadobacter sp. CY323]|uniref:PIN domain-containing protein n=1 Tax=Dyadobacter sp. CY323 TaxID=2907302 RepID=UPI001F2356D3|nr:PIN domain-containing protein [Dyadobacter sp. CY323]MCE6992929.1 PIN domain-containing protein [Dyadobacter sp. CY323]
MCIIIDTNSLGNVFNTFSQNHEEFEPIFKWILEGKGKVVFGGTKYMSEIGPNYRKLFTELRNAKKAVRVENEKVDQLEAKIRNAVRDADFDDQHIIALLISSGCKLICSEDRRAYPYFRNLLFFKFAKKRPKIYRGRSNSPLLTDSNISSICRPCDPLSNREKQRVNLILNI